MVNQPCRVLSVLRHAAGPVSGEALGAELGTSRVAAWKHIRELKRQGYGIESSRSGYRLISAPDLLLPGEFPGRESSIHHFHEIDSTMRVARELARGGAGNGTVVVAERQTRGRGRLDRTWFSPHGGIYLTVITRPHVVPSVAPRVNLVASVPVARVLRDCLGLPASVKWPNDVLVHGKKVCGILSEMEAECDLVRYINIGIGLNANARVAGEGFDAVSLCDLIGAPVRRSHLAEAVISDLLQRLSALSDPAVLDDWRELSETIGCEVQVQHGREVASGLAVDVEDSGALVVQAGDGRRVSVFAGDCTYGAA